MITCCLLIIFTSYGLVPLGRLPKRVTNFDFEGNIVEYLTPLDLLTANFINFFSAKCCSKPNERKSTFHLHGEHVVNDKDNSLLFND